MKKVIFTLLAASLMLLGTNAFAQISVNAGYLNSTLASKNSTDNANGAYAGITFNIPVAGGFGIAPGVYYSMLTSKDTANIGKLVSTSGTFMEHAINVPVYLNYAFDLSRDTKIFVFGGPTAQYGLASTVKYDANVAGVSGSSTVSNYDNEDYNRLNVYLGGGIGFGISALQITVGYDYGMMNQYKGDNATQCHRSNLKLGVGFAF
jgi:hypothetical protein